MKSYLIGRELNCDIVVNDPSNIVSRHHATLNVEGSGKMTIIDQSSNGTYINGIRITPNTPVPVTRKDVVSLAKAANLDWNRVQNPARTWVFAAVAVIVLGALIAGGFWLVNNRHSTNGFGGGTDNTVTTADSVKVNYTDSLAVIKKDIATLKTLHNQTKSRMDSVSQLMKKKNPCDSLEQVKKMVYAIQPEFDKINLSDLERAYQRVEDNLKDNNNQVASLIKNLKSTVSRYNESLKKISSTLDESSKKLKKIKNKDTGGKPDKPVKPVKPAKPEKDTTTVQIL